MVKLQAQYKDEKYNNKRVVEELLFTNEALGLKNVALVEAMDSKTDAEEDTARTSSESSVVEEEGENIAAAKVPDKKAEIMRV